MNTYYIVKGKVTDQDVADIYSERHNCVVNVGDVEWQFSDGLPDYRGSSKDFADLETGLKELSPAVFHYVV